MKIRNVLWGVSLMFSITAGICSTSAFADAQCELRADTEHEGNLRACDQMPSSQYQTCVGNAEARYGAAMRRCAQMDAGTPGGGGINNPPPRPPHNPPNYPPNYPPPSCQFINGAVYCPGPGQTCSFLNGYVYCGYSCQYLNGSAYCPEWRQTCNFINGAVYCGVNCQYLNGAVYCSSGGRGTPARPATPSNPV